LSFIALDFSQRSKTNLNITALAKTAPFISGKAADLFAASALAEANGNDVLCHSKQLLRKNSPCLSAPPPFLCGLMVT
jgi:hypothetical protein